jgi:hypothetical protein
MTQPAPAPVAQIAQATPAPVAAAPVVKTSTADRAAALKEKLESSPEPAVEEGRESSPAQSSSPSAADSGSDPDAQRRAERLARINKGVAELRAKEAAKNDERRQRAKYQTDQGETEKLRKRLAELEPMESAWKDPMSVLEWAERKGVAANDMVRALRERQSNPEAVAAAQAQAQTRTLEEKLRAELDGIRKQLADTEQKRADEVAQARDRYEGEHKAAQFKARVTEKASDYPLTAAFAQMRGPDTVIAVANKWLAEHLPENYDLETLHDHMEQLLEAFQVRGQQAAPSSAGDHPKNTGAAQPAITLNNRTTAGRETVVEETPLHRLPKSERVRRAREKYERE